MEVFNQLVYIGGEEIIGVDDITIDMSLDELMSSATLQIPISYLHRTDIIIKTSPIEIYIGYLPQGTTPTKENLVRKFSGYVTNLPASISKEQRVFTVDALDELEYFKRNHFLTKVSGASTLEGAVENIRARIDESFRYGDEEQLKEALNSLRNPDNLYMNSLNRLELLKYYGKGAVTDITANNKDSSYYKWVPGTDLEIDEKSFTDETDVVVDFNPSYNLIDILKEIKENSVLYIKYNPKNHTLEFITPAFLHRLARDSGTTEFNTTLRFRTYHFNTSNIIKQLDYGNLSNEVNRVIFVGIGGNRGVAVDYASEALGRGVNYQIFRTLDTGSQETLRRRARDKLLEMQKNHKIHFSTPLIKNLIGMLPGELCTIDDGGLRYGKNVDSEYGKEKFIIESLKFSMKKGREMEIEISVFSNTLVQFPEELVTSGSTGIATPLVVTQMGRSSKEDFS